MPDFDVEKMVHHYAICALWSSTGEDGEPLDAEHEVTTIAPETMAQFRTDCAAFAESCAADLEGMTPEQAGHDFWLTRNGHGAGFWDRGLGERGERLTQVARPYGEVELYVGDDGQIWA